MRMEMGFKMRGCLQRLVVMAILNITYDELGITMDDHRIC